MTTSHRHERARQNYDYISRSCSECYPKPVLTTL